MTIRRTAPEEYTKTTWADGAEGGTAITATRLNNIEDAVEEVTNYATDEDADLSDAEQAIADNAADIAALQDSVACTQRVAKNINIATGMNYFEIGDVPIVDNKTAVGVVNVRTNHPLTQLAKAYIYNDKVCAQVYATSANSAEPIFIDVLYRPN